MGGYPHNLRGREKPERFISRWLLPTAPLTLSSLPLSWSVCRGGGVWEGGDGLWRPKVHNELIGNLFHPGGPPKLNRLHGHSPDGLLSAWGIGWGKGGAQHGPLTSPGWFPPVEVEGGGVPVSGRGRGARSDGCGATGLFRSSSSLRPFYLFLSPRLC